ncbi:MAG: aldolase/citrate lyase family protein [Opitutaceae bacterium]
MKKLPSMLLAALLVGPMLAAESGEYTGPKRINKAIELLEAGQPVYYTYGVRGGDEPRNLEEAHALGKSLSKTWADIIMYDMEHAPLDFALLRSFMLGLVEGGPTPSGHRTPAVIVTLPVLGLDEENVKANGWMIQQALATGIHGIHLCRARDPEAVREFVRTARYPFHKEGVGDGLDEGLRGMGSHLFASGIWGIDKEDYFRRADPWPLNPDGEILLGVKIEDPHALRNCESTLRVPGLAFAESGPRDMGLSYGYLEGRADPPLPPEVIAASERVLAAANAAGVVFLDNILPDNVIERLEWGVMIGAGGKEEAAEIGRRQTGRTMPWK